MKIILARKEALDELDEIVTRHILGEHLGVEFEGMPAIVTGERTYNAKNTTFRVNAGSINEDPYPDTDIRNQFPYNQIKTAKVNDAFEVQAWIDEPGFSDASGHIMTWLPKTYYRQDSVYEFSFSEHGAGGFKIDPLFWDYQNEVERDGVWIATLKSSQLGSDNKLTSQVDVGYHVDARMDTVMRPWAQANGAGWGLADLALRDYLRKLYHVATASWDSQTAIGRGVCDLRYSVDDKVTSATSDANTVIVAEATAALYQVGEWVSLGTSTGNTARFANRKITEKAAPDGGNVTITVDGDTFSTQVDDVLWHTGQIVTEEMLLAMGNESGYIGTDGRVPVAFFGIWDLWGNLWEWVDGAWKHDSVVEINVSAAEDTDYVTINGTQLTRGTHWSNAAELASAIDALSNVSATANGDVVTASADDGYYLVASRTNVVGTITLTVTGYGFFYSFDPQKYDSIDATAPTATDFTRHPTAIPISNGYLGEMEGDPAVPQTLTGGSASAGTCDYYNQAADYRGLRVGGTWVIGSSVGFWYWVVDSSPTRSDVIIGSRLLGRP